MLLSSHEREGRDDQLAGLDIVSLVGKQEWRWRFHGGVVGIKVERRRVGSLSTLADPGGDCPLIHECS